MREGINNAWSNFRQDEGLLEQGPAAQRLYGGRMDDARRKEASMVTREAMSKLHKALGTIHVLRKRLNSTKLNWTSKMFTKTGLFFSTLHFEEIFMLEFKNFII